MTPAPPRPTSPTMRPPNPPRAPAVPRAQLRFSAQRGPESRALDGQTVRSRGHGDTEFPIPPAEDWPTFYRELWRRWEVGYHVALVGQTRSGKTTLAVPLLDIRDFVCVLGTKPRDDSLYDPLIKRGYKMVDKFDAEDIDNPRVIFRPPLRDPSKEAKAEQREAFRKALTQVYMTGGWCIYLDEVRYLTEELGLQNELNTLWLQGAGLQVTIVAGTQRPVSVPLNMFEQAFHFFLWKIAGAEDRRTASAYTGQLAPVVFETTQLLPRFEFLYVDKLEDYAVRSKAPRSY